LNDFKDKLNQMMGDTSKQERRIKQRVHEKLQPTAKKTSWQVVFVMIAIPVVAMFLIFTMNTSNQFSSDQGPGIPYDPLDDLGKISELQKTKQLSTIDHEEFAVLPHFDKVDDLYYIDKEVFSLNGSSKSFHTVIERKENLYDARVYEVGDVVRTMTNSRSHLPIYADAYYEIIAIPGDRIVLKNGQLKINGKPLQTEIMELYKEQGNTIAGGYDQLLNAREYFLLNHFPAKETLQGAAITPVHKIYGQVVGIATEDDTDSIYLDYLSGKLNGDYTPEQYFDLYLYDESLGLKNLPQRSAITQIDQVSERFIEASYRKVIPISENKVEIRYQYGREGVSEHKFYMKLDTSSGRWLLDD